MSRKFLNGIDLTSNRGINFASPTAATDAVNKAYVDNALAGLSWKLDVRAATTTNGTLATAYANTSVLDGVTLATNDRILLKNQTSQLENGIYTVNASGAPTRSTDTDSTAELNNATVSVLDGTVNGIGGSLNVNGTSWTQITKNPTIGSSNIVWALFAAGTVYTASATGGLLLTAGAFSVLLPASSGLATSASGLVVQLDTTPGLVLGAGGVKVLLNGTNPALTLTGGLAVIPGTGITVAANTVAIDTSTVTRKFSASIGNASLTAFTVTHNLNTFDVDVQVFDNGTTETVEADVTRPTVNTVLVTFAVAPTTNQFRVLVRG